MPPIRYTGSQRDISAARTFGRRVLVADENALVRWAVARMVRDSDDLVPGGEAATLDEAAYALQAATPDVLVIDCGLGYDAGWGLAAQARKLHPAIGIVVTAPAESDAALLRALDIDAAAFVAKTAPVADIMAAIRHAATSPGSFRAAGLADALRRSSQKARRGVLSGRERQVLGLLRAGRSVPEVAADLYVSLSTAKTYVARVYEKLGAKNRAQALMAAVELGLFDDFDLLAG